MNEKDTGVFGRPGRPGALALTGCVNGGDQKVTAEQAKKEAKQSMNTAVAA
jgi:hypothetical protein